MKDIIEAVDKELLLAELTPDKLLRKTNFNNNEIYCFTHHEAPNLMREVGRLREITFRSAGGGTGKDCDLDEYDLSDHPYKQLIVWDTESQCILGGYRYLESKCAPLNEKGNPLFATSQLFHYSEVFKQEYLPYLIELGRSFVVPDQQASQGGGRKGLFTLDNLWDGLGALVTNNPDVKYLFGKVTMYTHYNKEARNYLLYFMNLYFGGHYDLIHLIDPLNLEMDEAVLSQSFSGNNYEEDYKFLSKKVRELGENIPPLINAYMGLSPTMKVFGTSINPYFGGVEETGIMLTIKDIYPKKSERHFQSYLDYLENK